MIEKNFSKMPGFFETLLNGIISLLPFVILAVVLTCCLTDQSRTVVPTPVPTVTVTMSPMWGRSLEKPLQIAPGLQKYTGFRKK